MGLVHMYVGLCLSVCACLLFELIWQFRYSYEGRSKSSWPKITQPWNHFVLAGHHDYYEQHL